jgi:predicted DNA-binding protein with PD1-like motif
MAADGGGGRKAPGAVLGFFDLDKKDYKKIPGDTQVEVLSLVGDKAISIR